MASQTPRGHVWLAQPYMDSLFAKTPAGFYLVPAVPGTDISRVKSTLEVSKRAPRKAAPAPGDTREDDVYGLPPAPLAGLGSPLGSGFDLLSPLAPGALSKEERRRLRQQLQADLAKAESLEAKVGEKKEKFKVKFSNVAPLPPPRAAGFGAPAAPKRQPKLNNAYGGAYMMDEAADYGYAPPPPQRPARERRPAMNGNDSGDGAYAPPPPPKPKAEKRPPPPPPPPLPPPRGPREAKQRRVDAERAKRAQALLKICSSILASCKKKAHGIYFALPVDHVTLNIPDYPTIVTRPMDYSTVSAKLQNGEYASPLDFKADMELIYANCALYNPSHTPVGQAGIAAAETFATEWEKSALDFKLQDETILRHGEDAAIEAMPEEGDIPPELLRAPGAPAEKPVKKERDREAEKQRRLERLAAEREAAEARRAEALPERRSKRPAVETDSEDDDDSEDEAPRPQRKRPAPAPPREREQREPPPRPPPRPQRPAEKPPAQRAPMRFEQKRQLSVALANLPIARQARVVQIISDLAQTQDDEIEIDLDQMDNTTLWRLFDYVFPKSQQLAMGITHDDLVAPAPTAAVPATGAGPAPAKPAAKPAESSSDSSDTDSSSDDDDKPPAPAAAAGGPPGSEGGDSASGKAKEAAAGALPPSGLGALPLGGPVAAAAGGDVAMADAAPAILADVAVRKEVTIQNASSWANFAAQGDAGAGGATTPGGNGNAAPGEAAIPDALWSEFARKEAEKAAAAKERAEAEARMREARQHEEAEREAAVAKAKADAEAAEAAARAAAEAEEARRVAEREAARERARAELQNVDQTVNLDEQRSLMEEMGGGGGAYGGFAMPAFPGMDVPAPPPPPPAPAEMEEGEV